MATRNRAPVVTESSGATCVAPHYEDEQEGSMAAVAHPPAPPLARAAVRTLSAALLLVIVPSCTSAEGHAVRTAQEVQTVSLDGERVSLYNLAGNAEITSHSGRAVVVEIQLGGRDADQLRIATGPIGGRETLRVIYPADEVHYSRRGGRSRLDLRVNADGTFERRDFNGIGDLISGLFGGDGATRVSTAGGNLEAWADLRILIPEGRDVSLHLAMGDVNAHDAASALEIGIGSGGLEAVGWTGPLTARTGSGHVSARDIVGDVRLDTGSGSIRVRSLEGDLVLDTGSGSVQAGDLRGERAMIDTGSGSVQVDDVDLERLAVDTGSGNVDLAGISARDLHVDTGSGSVEIGLRSDVDHMEIDTGSGRVTVSVPSTFGADLDIETGSGGIDVDVPVRVRGRAERDHLRGTVGDGDGTVRIDTGSGGVRLRSAS